jgi:ribonuclease G
MAKELIVSVNGREKKIAIIENDRVTEFYIERGEQNQGIVGNIYKGRVMRVLPGMQSAFVDIGLERDAFLYVSDFFDEEAEFERIVVDKAKKGDTATAARAATEHIELARVERERHIEASHERAEPLREAEAEPLEAIAAEPLEAIVAEPSAIRPAASGAPDLEEASAGRKRGRRGGRRRSRELPPRALSSREEEVRPSLAEDEKIRTPFVVAGSSFERVSDEEERAANGEMLKDARLQERLLDEVHAAEFDMEDLPSAPVGSLLSSSMTDSGSFQRIDDGDDSAAVPSTRTQELVSARVRDFVDELADESSTSPSFERVSDDSEAEAEGHGTLERVKNLFRRGKTPKRTTATSRRATKSKQAEPEAETDRLAADAFVENDTENGGETEFLIVGPSDPVDESYPDSEARITSGRPHEEFATRRGGRRRRRTTKKPAGAANGNGANGEDREVEAAPDKPAEPAEAQPVETTAAREPQRPDPRRRRRPPRREHRQPAITDLLREGQEILVQIAKEPIAKKGARITSHIALPGRYLVYMPTVEHLGVSRKIDSESERARLRKLIQKIREEEDVPSGGFIVRTAGVGISEADLRADARYLVRTWLDIRDDAEKAKAPAMVHQDLDLVQRILRDQLSDEFTAIKIDSEEEYQRIVEFVNRMQPRMVKRVKLYTRDTPILEEFGVQAEIDKAIKPRVWLRSGGYLVINQTEALVAIDVNTGKFVGRGATRLEDTITRTNLEAVDEIVRQIRLRDLGGIIVLDLIDMEERRNRTRVMQALQEALRYDKSPTKVLAFNDFGLVIMTRKRVKQSLERTLCATCSYCQGAGLVKSPQTICYEILEQARRLSKEAEDGGERQPTLRINPEVARALRESERDVLNEIEEYLGGVDITSDPRLHQEQFDFAFV